MCVRARAHVRARVCGGRGSLSRVQESISTHPQTQILVLERGEDDRQAVALLHGTVQGVPRAVALHQVDEGEAAAAYLAQELVLRLQQVYRFCRMAKYLEVLISVTSASSIAIWFCLSPCPYLSLCLCEER